MNKRYFWIYVLPVLMVTTVIGFGVLGVKSAVNAQKMQAELAKIEWKMEPVETETDNWTPGKDAEFMRKTFGEDILIWTDFSDGLALLYYRDKLVCAKEDGTVVFEKKASIPENYIEREHENAVKVGLNRDGFNDGMAVFTLDGSHYGILDKEGNVLLEPVFKGKNTLTVMKNHHVGFFYEKEFRIGELVGSAGGEHSE